MLPVGLLVPLLSGLPLVVSAIAFQWQIRGFVKGGCHLPTTFKDTRCCACFSFPLSSPWGEGWGDCNPLTPLPLDLPVFTDFTLKLLSIIKFFLLFVCFCCFHFVHLISPVVSMHFQITTSISLSDAKVKDQDEAADHTMMASVQVMKLDVSTKH